MATTYDTAVPEIVEFTGYTEQEKLEIARRYLVPRQLGEHALDDDELSFGDEVSHRREISGLQCGDSERKSESVIHFQRRFLFFPAQNLYLLE